MIGSVRILLAAALVAIAAGAVWLSDRGGAVATAPQPVWTEVAWPFAIDQWGRGKAFRCGAADCGAEVNVYLRSKIGFCNCTTGVADDPELERLSDFDLFGGRVTALAQGRPIEVGWMKGRARAYTLAGWLGGRSLLSTAFANECDALVATAVLGRDRVAEIEPQVIAFLNGRTVVRWAKGELGL